MQTNLESGFPSSEEASNGTELPSQNRGAESGSHQIEADFPAAPKIEHTSEVSNVDEETAMPEPATSANTEVDVDAHDSDAESARDVTQFPVEVSRHAPGSKILEAAKGNPSAIVIIEFKGTPEEGVLDIMHHLNIAVGPRIKGQVPAMMNPGDLVNAELYINGEPILPLSEFEVGTIRQQRTLKERVKDKLTGWFTSARRTATVDLRESFVQNVDDIRAKQARGEPLSQIQELHLKVAGAQTVVFLAQHAVLANYYVGSVVSKEEVVQDLSQDGTIFRKMSSTVAQSDNSQ